MALSWALMSGASTGIGRTTALSLLNRNFSVIAGVRSEAAASRLQQQASAIKSGHLETVTLDVTDQASIDAAVAHATTLTGADGLRAVINNAGIAVPGPSPHRHRRKDHGPPESLLPTSIFDNILAREFGIPNQ